MMSRGRCSILGLVLVASFLVLGPLVVSGFGAASELIPVYTPPAGGTVYVLGIGVTAVTNRNLTDMRFVHEAATGTMDMIRRMMARESQKKPVFALFGSPDGARAYRGEGEYAGKPFTALRSVVFLNGSDQYFVVPANSPIKSFADVKGKRLGIGPAGSTVSTSALFFFQQYGITKNDFKPQYYTFKEVVEGIQDGSLDGGFLGGAYPMPSYTEISLTRNVRIVPVEDRIFKQIAADHPYYYRNVIKAGAYKGLAQDTPVYGFTTVIFTHAGVSDELVYKFLKNLYEHRQDYYAIHSSAAKDFVAENLLKGLPVPLHPGAERYLKEIGVLKK